MTKESLRHFLLGPLASAQACIFLLKKDLHHEDPDATIEIDKKLRSNLLDRTLKLDEQLIILQQRIEKHLGEHPSE
jgi:hypothetical protein